MQASIFLDDKLRKSAVNGSHNFIGHLIAVLDDNGYRVDLKPEAETYRGLSPWGMTHMAPPPPGGLTFRRVYHYPFWAIEPSSERWEWAVAKSRYSPELVSKDAADRLYRRWQDRLFPETARRTSREGFVYVPLQGRLLQHRSFQSCSPMEMLSCILRADPKRRIIATFHPNEHYTRAEIDAVEALATRTPHLSVRTGGMEELLRTCDYVVTMNSAAAFNGYFFGKPCILFGRIDFHHIALTASPDDLSAFAAITDHTPDYARYLKWFWQDHCINAGRPDVRERIRDALARGGWPVQG